MTHRSSNFEVSLQGSVYFLQRLTATNVLATSNQRRSCQLTIPRRFLREHGNKFRRSVVLRSGLSNIPMTFWLSFCPSRSLPEVVFSGKWRAFAISNGLVKGDQLIFSLSAMSQFRVYLFDGHGDPKVPQMLQAPLKWTQEIELSQQKMNQSLGCKREDLSVEENDDLVNTMCAVCGLRRDNSENEFAGFEFNDTSSNTSKKKIERDLPSQDQTCLPSFSKRIIGVPYLEIPRDFGATYGCRLHNCVQLQGIHEDSAVKNVHSVRYMNKGHARIYLKSGWDDFVSDNKLRVGQELLFTLTADSFFTVRKEMF